MKEIRSTRLAQKRWIRVLRIHRQLFLFGLIILGVCTIHVTSLPMVNFPLKPSPDTGPYQDEEFLSIANDTIYGLSNQTIRSSTDLWDLQTTQLTLSKMSVSPDLYPIAQQINAYLFYVVKAGNEYFDATSLTSKPYSPVYEDNSQLRIALEYQAASHTIWNQIQGMYPGVEPYRLETSKKPFSVNEDPDFKWPNNPFSSYSYQET